MTLYQISADKVSHDLLDGEVIAIHFETGFYYSLRGTAAQLWEVLRQPVSTGRIASYFSGISGDQISQLQAFLDEFVNDGLLTVSEGTDAMQTGNGSLGVFSEPVFEKYTDMQELLLADPVHDVQDQVGWPYLKKEP